jgi:hypothetical protein
VPRSLYFLLPEASGHQGKRIDLGILTRNREHIIVRSIGFGAVGLD